MLGDEAWSYLLNDYSIDKEGHKGCILYRPNWCNVSAFLRGVYGGGGTDSVLYFNFHLALLVSHQTCQLLKAFTLHRKCQINLTKQKIQLLLENDSSLADFNHPSWHVWEYA